MVARILLVIVLAIAVGFGVSKVFEQGDNTELVGQSGEQLDAALSGGPDLTSTERWYDNSNSIGLMAGGAVFVVGVVVIAVTKPKAPQRSARR